MGGCSLIQVSSPGAVQGKEGCRGTVVGEQLQTVTVGSVEVRANRFRAPEHHQLIEKVGDDRWTGNKVAVKTNCDTLADTIDGKRILCEVKLQRRARRVAWGM